jgi:hypothetical protein
MKIIRTAFLLSTGFSVGAVYTLRHSNEIVEAIGDLKDEVVKAFSEQEDPERLTKLIEYFDGKPDEHPIITFHDNSHFTVGDLRALSVHYDPAPVGLPEHAYPTQIILEKLETFARENGIDDAGMIEFIDNVTNPTKENTSP